MIQIHMILRFTYFGSSYVTLVDIDKALEMVNAPAAVYSKLSFSLKSWEYSLQWKRTLLHDVMAYKTLTFL